MKLSDGCWSYIGGDSCFVMLELWIEMKENMRTILKIVLGLICSVVLSPACIGQQISAYKYKPDGWYGLTLDKSTPEDAIHTLGQPSGDTSDRLRIQIMENWVIAKHKQKIFRVLTYKEVAGAKEAKLAFLENKLVRIYIEYEDKQFPASDLKEKFGTDFFLLTHSVSSDSTPSMFEGQKESPAPGGYPAGYCMISVTPQSLISGVVMVSKIKDMVRYASGVKTKDPGSLYSLEIISRTLAKN